MQFHLYTFVIGYDRLFVAESSWKAARNIIVRLPKYKHLSLTEITGKRLAQKCADRAGILSASEAVEQAAWWKCRCGNNSFLLLDDGTSCRCRQCGRESRIVY